MKNKRLLIVILAGAALAIGGFIYLQLKPHYSTSFEDAGGWVYKCSKPIRVKDQGAKYMSGKPSLTPVDPNEMATYCHKIGIE